MKLLQQVEAKLLRKQGKSIKQIAREINVAQSSVSIWVRGINLSDAQKTLLKQSQFHPSVIER